MATQTANFTNILRRVFILFLLFSLLITAGAFILRHRINVRLDRLSNQLQAPSAQQGISALLLDLDIAENNFQKASAEGSAADLAAYNKQLDTIFGGITKIIDHYNADGDSSLPQSRQQLAKGLQKRLALSKQLFRLRRNFDSLLRVNSPEALKGKGIIQKTQKPAKVVTDTLVSTQKEISKKGLFGRLRDALRPTQSVKVVTVKQKEAERTISDAQAKKLLAQLGSEYGRLATSSQALIAANLNLLTALRNLLRQLQDIDRISYERSREVTLRAYASAAADLNTFTGIALVAVLVFIILLLIYVRRAGWAERRLRVERSRALRLATQKSEILAILSHEIRNKLMAINGAIFTLKRTELSPAQEQKIGAINLASGLVLETVNNILDAEKMEQGYAETRKSEPFKPGEAIADAVDAMRFMAENKQLALTIAQSEDTLTTVSGDSFRLKQVLLNLLSNAIKYTDQGTVTVHSRLANSAQGYLLSVDVADTGAGIPKNKQARLFSPYYQAGGQKPGTGLGLYLCRELIVQQGGEIHLKSEAGGGTTISFTIPYGVVGD